ncbi:MAG: cytochrome c biogenesis CcdA family protein [Alphaproteobacteria bacterium]
MLEISSVGVLTAFLAGAISFLSPCVLPLVPAYVSYIAGSADRVLDPAEARVWRRSTIGLSALFVLGFSTVFIALGASATALSRMLLTYRQPASIAGGLIIILFGLFMTGLVRVPALSREFRIHRGSSGGRPAGAYLLGLSFGFGWTPCIGPVLGTILTLSAMSSTTASGIALLAIYSAGLGIPFLLSAAFTTGLATQLKAMRRAGWLLQIAAGGIMIVFGLAMMTGTLSNFSFWLLEQFPIFTRIG